MEAVPGRAQGPEGTAADAVEAGVDPVPLRRWAARRPARWSVRLRATVAATLIVAVALGGAAVALNRVLGTSLEQSAAAEASLKAVRVADTLAVTALPAIPAAGAGGTPCVPATTSDETPGVPAGDPARAPGVPAAKPSGAAGSSAGGPGGTAGSSAAGAGGAAGAVADPDVQVGRLSTAAVPGVSVQAEEYDAGYASVTTTVDTSAGPVLVTARSSLAPARTALSVLNRMLVFGIPALLLLVAAMTWFLVGKALVPVSGIREKLADITARDLHRRVPVPHARDEVAALARTVNATLDRLENAVEQHKRFVADAAHELRSPIATLRTRLELVAPPTGREALADVERLQALAADLLLLARLDAGEPPGDAVVDLGQVVVEEALRPRPRREVPVRLDLQPDVLVRGSRAQLARLVTNLVDNAVRHASSAVDVRVVAAAGVVLLEVRDDGPGIPPEHRAAVFDRFTRLDGARARDEGGAGLGLAIVREITGLHGGQVSVADGGPGACLQVRLAEAPSVAPVPEMIA
ncbi:sensor histidine kinase [Sphaerisporangium fuscum]|uniref:sensor histidine kinase n=1 Tax=Sphaerisporangium fuscum TaxID=2835868 RepID=UPI0027E329F5|nr:HAMP domain-containing sensor histidine kinase [Sphaerisporangium fuscum]